MMTFFSNQAHWLPIVFAALMAISVLVYVILDGYDLGVGILSSRGNAAEKDQMLHSIGPFWDANETWLVLGIGLSLVAFPIAHGKILTALYLPTAFMLIGLILRGVAFDFRAKAHVDHKTAWNRCFFFGSLLTTFSQGYMLGSYIVGFEPSIRNIAFAASTGLFLIAGYSLTGATWLIMKTTGALQKKAIYWAKRSLWITAAGLLVVSWVTPLMSDRIFEKWFNLSAFTWLFPIPVFAGMMILYVDHILQKLPLENDRLCWVPFVGTLGIFTSGFIGLAYSFYPYIVPEKITIWQAASAPESLLFILVGTLIVLPCIIGYTIFAYRVFWGKVQ